MKKVVKITGWTVGMAFAAVLIVGGKSPDPDKLPYYAVEGGIVGFLLGSIFARKSSAMNSKSLAFGCYFTRSPDGPITRLLKKPILPYT